MENKYTLIINTISLFISFIGLIYAGYQIWVIRKQMKNAIEELKLTVKIHNDNHEWNRRIASQEAITQFRMKNKTKELRNSLNQFDINEIIPLKAILEKFETEPDLKDFIHETLNTFEGYARGIVHGIYDEIIVKSAIKGAMIRHYSCFLPYINHVRKTRNPDLYCDLENIVNKWKSEEKKVEYRQRTGSN